MTLNRWVVRGFAGLFTLLYSFFLVRDLSEGDYVIAVLDLAFLLVTVALLVKAFRGLWVRRS